MQAQTALAVVMSRGSGLKPFGLLPLPLAARVGAALSLLGLSAEPSQPRCCRGSWAGAAGAIDLQRSCVPCPRGRSSAAAMAARRAELLLGAAARRRWRRSAVQ